MVVGQHHGPTAFGLTISHCCWWYFLYHKLPVVIISSPVVHHSHAHYQKLNTRALHRTTMGLHVTSRWGHVWRSRLSAPDLQCHLGVSDDGPGGALWLVGAPGGTPWVAEIWLGSGLVGLCGSCGCGSMSSLFCQTLGTPMSICGYRGHRWYARGYEPTGFLGGSYAPRQFNHWPWLSSSCWASTVATESHSGFLWNCDMFPQIIFTKPRPRTENIYIYRHMHRIICIWLCTIYT